MKTLRLMAMGLLVAPLLAGCVVEEGPRPSGGYYAPPPPPPSYSAPRRVGPSVDDGRLEEGQRHALQAGCHARFERSRDARERIYECEHGMMHASREAMERGCYMRYEGNRHKLRDCLDAARS